MIYVVKRWLWKLFTYCFLSFLSSTPHPSSFPSRWSPLTFPDLTPFLTLSSPCLSLLSFPHLFLSMLHPFSPFPTFSFPCYTLLFLSHLFSFPCYVLSFLSCLSFPWWSVILKMFVVVCFGSVSDLADLQTEAVLLTVASNGLIHVTGGLCLSSSSFEMRPSPRWYVYIINSRHCVY